MKKIGFLACFLIICVFTISPVAAKKKVKSIKFVGGKSTIEMYPGDKKQMKVLISPAKGTSKAVIFKSTKPKVVSVSKKGKIKCKKSGNATIIAQATDGSKKKAKIKIKVGYRVQNIVIINGFSTEYLRINERVKLNVLVLPSYATNPNVEFSSSKPDVVEVTDDGTLVPQRVGWATIKVKAKDGSKVFIKQKFKVVNPVEKIQIQEDSTNLYCSKQADGSLMLMKGAAIKLGARVTPIAATDKSIEWEVSDENVAEIKDGVLTAKKNGVVTVKAIAQDFKKCSDSIKVKITSQPKGDFLCISHRGVTEFAPENSMAAVKLAFEGKYDGVEIDLNVTKDNKFVLSHDDSLMRMCGVNKKISELTLKEACGYKITSGVVDSNYANQNIASLSDVFVLLKKYPKKKLYLDLKQNFSEEQIAELLETIYDAGVAGQIRILTVYEDTVATIRKMGNSQEENIAIDYLCWIPTANNIQICEYYDARISIKAENMTPEWDKELQKRGMEYAIWCPKNYVSFCDKVSKLKFSACTVDRYYCVD